MNPEKQMNGFNDTNEKNNNSQLRDEKNEGLPTYAESQESENKQHQQHQQQQQQQHNTYYQPVNNNTAAPYVHFPHPRSNTNFPGGKTTTYNNANSN